MSADWVLGGLAFVWVVMDQSYAWLMVRRRKRLRVGFHPWATARSRFACLRAFALLVPFALTFPPCVTRYLPLFLVTLTGMSPPS